VARGQRVLFVCEKRAAIDVVYHRLRQKGLDRLSCLIHDSQADKKEFVMDLKRTYEEFLASTAESHTQRDRQQIVEQIARALATLEEFHQAMTSRPNAAGGPVRELLERLIELKDRLPDIAPRQREQVPEYAHIHSHRERLE